MAKPGSPFPGPAGLVEWLPLLGAICQILACLGDEEETEPTEPTEPSGARAVQGLQAGEEHG
jgi:hypothetical protein